MKTTQSKKATESRCLNRLICCGLLILTIGLYGCGQKLLSKPPANLAPQPLPSVALSRVDLPIVVKKTELQGLAESAIPKDFHFDGSGDKTFWTYVGPKLPFIDRIKVSKVVKYSWHADLTRGLIALALGDNRIQATTRVEGQAGVRLDAGAIITKHADIAATVGASAAAQLDTNWTLRSKSDGILTVHKADAGFDTPFGHVPISFREKLEAAVRPKINELAAKMDEKLSRLDIHSRVVQEWPRLQQPIKLGSTPEAWLRIQPVAARFSGIRSEGGDLLLAVGLDAYTDVVVGAKPPPHPPAPLPPVQPASGAGGFTLAVPVLAGYGELKAVARTNLVGNSYTVGQGIVIKLTGMDCYGNGSNLVVMVVVEAKLPNKWFATSGQIYFTGQPVYDPKTKLLSIQGFDFDANTRSALLNSADWLLHDAFRKAIAAKLQWGLAGRLTQAQQTLNKSLEYLTVAEGIVLRAKVDDANAVGIVVQRNGVAVLPVFRGQATLSVEKLRL